MIRVLRLMEYEYPDVETMDRDMSGWAVPPIGTKNFTHTVRGRTIRSAILPNFGGWMPSEDVLTTHAEKERRDPDPE